MRSLATQRVLCLAAIALLAGAPGPGAAQTAERQLIEPGGREAAGQLFELYSNVRAPGQLERSMVEGVFGGAEGLQGERSMLEAISSDDLADIAVRAAEGLLTYFAHVRFYRNAYKDPAKLEAQLQAAISTIYLPDGRTKPMSLILTQFYYAETFASATRILTARPATAPVPQLSGKWVISNVSSGCGAMPAGPVEITQYDRLLEVDQAKSRVLFGVIGDTGIAAVLEEPRFATLTIQNDGTQQVRYPDRLRSVYRAPISSTELSFSGKTKAEDCAFKLSH